MLNLDFSLYKGNTLLKQWWKIVKSHFIEVQTAHNELEEALAAEERARKATDAALAQEETVRADSDKALQTKIETETERRNDSVTELNNAIRQEASDRETADNELITDLALERRLRSQADTIMNGDLTRLKDAYHVHDNKNVLDGITDSDIENWNGITEQVTMTQLNGAMEAEEAERRAADEEISSYSAEVIGGLMLEIALLQRALGITVYDGGLFSRQYDGEEMDVGDFETEASDIFDCGGFETVTVSAAVGTVDGGIY